MPKGGVFLRTCPSCGHRFHVKLIDEMLLSDRRAAELVARDGKMIVTGAATGIWGAPRGKVWSLTPTGPQERETFTTKTKEFEDSFKCGRCGHQWSEKRTEEKDRA